MEHNLEFSMDIQSKGETDGSCEEDSEITNKEFCKCSYEGNLERNTSGSTAGIMVSFGDGE